MEDVHLPNMGVMSDELKKRLDDVKYKARHAALGSMFFVEVSSLPLVSVIVVTGQEEKLGRTVKKLHLRYVSQPSNYPSTFDGGLELESIGYSRYLTETKDSPKLLLKEYQTQFVNICNDTNCSIHKNHGVKCFDNEDKRKNGEYFILHICDILNFMVGKLSNSTVEVVVRSNLLMEISKDMINEFECIYLKENDRTFMLNNIDLFYYCYSYLGNNSFVPIRTKVPSDSNHFIHSSFFTNDRYFLKHQIGKMHEINNNGCGLVSKHAYRTI